MQLLSIASINHSFMRSGGIESVRANLTNAKTRSLNIKGTEWHIYCDMSAMSIQDNDIVIVDHIHHVQH